MRRFIKGVFSFCSVLLVLSCDDVLEENISDEEIFIITPIDGASIEGNLVQFRWNTLEGAKEYRVQIFEANEFIVFDSLLVSTILNHQMNPGEYSWHVRGENFAYSTPYSLRSQFSVVPSLDLTDQVITLDSPEDISYMNDVDIVFSWQSINTASSYEFDLLKVEGSNQVSIYQDLDLVNPTITIDSETITEDAEYVWRVNAKNGESATKDFSRRFFRDTVVPPVPVLLTPTENQIFSTNQEISFSWGFSDTGEITSPIIGTFEVSSDENFGTIIVTETTGSEEFKISFENSGTYYWRVKGTDEAGNKGVYSDPASIIIQ